MLAVNVVAVATPLTLVFAVTVSVPLAKVPVAPVAGAVNVTAVPATNTGLPLASSTVALKGLVGGADRGGLTGTGRRYRTERRDQH